MKWRIPICAAVIALLFLFDFFMGGDVVPRIDPEELYLPGTQIIYFGRENCESCKEAKPHIHKAMDRYDIEIRYFDTDLYREHELFPQVIADFKVEEVPCIVKIQDGAYVNGVSLISEEGEEASL